ncbi:MAG: tetratricopeptide repeat protein [Treponema bryantii]|nr:tetratricopeptide repeat protein [Treponema bryantii]
MNKNCKLVCFLLILFANSLLFCSPKKTVKQIFDEGVEYQLDENWYAAAQNYLEVVNQNPAFSQAWFNLAECSYKLEEFDLALTYLQNAEKYEKNNSKVQNLKGMILLALGEKDKALEVFNQVLAVYPNDIDAHFGIAEIELYNGKFTGAELEYIEALKRQTTNRKALLSLALVCAETGRFTQSDKYLRQALQYYSGETEVHYIASVINVMKGDLKAAELQIRIAIEIKNDYEKAYELLSQILYMQERYNEVIDISDYLIRRNRSNSKAWYIKGIAQNKLGLIEDSIDTWATGLSLNPQDEIMRFAMEMELRDSLALEDFRRSKHAKFHLENARQYESRYDNAGAVYEYQRTLLIDPMNSKARFAYANMLELNGMYELYLEQLKFIQENTPDKITKKVSDKIEAYESLLSDTLSKKWNVDSFYLDKTRWNIAIFYTDETNSFIHADANRIAALAASDVFSGIAITSVKSQVTPVSSYSEAFKNARNNKFDYFVILSVSESDEDITLKSSFYSGRTGTEISKENFYSTGNNKFSTVLRRFRNSILEKLTVKGKILNRNGKQLLVDLGKAENIVENAEFKILKKGSVKTADSNVGLIYKESDVVGSLVITKAGEEISEAELTKHGFYDRVNINDEIILVSLPESKGKNDANGNAIDTVPQADEKGNPLVKNDVEQTEGEKLVLEIRNAVEQPSIVQLLRNIY